MAVVSNKQVALVTGGSRGIGLATARQLCLDGYRVAVLATGPEERYPEATKTLKSVSGDYRWVSGDVSVDADRIRAVDQVIREFHEIHVLVNNAGVAPKERADLLEMMPESYDRVVNTNTRGTMFLTQLVARQMCKQPVYGKKRGTIINVSSCSSVVSSVNRGEYCVSKAGISMLTTLYADRLAREQIFVFEVRPGVIATDMTEKVQGKYDALIADGAFPIARWGTPEDVANAVSAFCGDQFCYSTGNYIDVDGGFHIQRL